MPPIFLSPSLQKNPYIDPPGGLEWEHMFDVARRLRSLLELNGEFTVQMSDPAWVALTSSAKLAAVVARSNDFGARLHLCLHSDAGPVGANGTTTFYAPGSAAGERAARIVHSLVARVSPGSDNGVKPRADLYELNHTNAPAVYCELAFHTDPADAFSIERQPSRYALALYRGACDVQGVSRNGRRALALKRKAVDLARLNGLEVPSLNLNTDELGAAAKTLLQTVIEEV